MNPHSAASLYRQEAFESAPPIKIVRMLYEGALKFLDRAEACDPNDPSSKFVHWLTRTDAVVSELRLSLAPEHAPEVAEQLEKLYLFCESQIQGALLERRVEYIPAIRDVLGTLLEAWSKIELDARVPG